MISKLLCMQSVGRIDCMANGREKVTFLWSLTFLKGNDKDPYVDS